MVVIAAIAQFIGPLTVPIGSISIVLLPMIWALLMGVLVSGQRYKPLPIDLQHRPTPSWRSRCSSCAAGSSLTLGPQLPELLRPAPALLLQELGNVFGSLLLALPLAVLLRMGPATIGDVRSTAAVLRDGDLALRGGLAPVPRRPVDVRVRVGLRCHHRGAWWPRWCRRWASSSGGRSRWARASARGR